MGPFKAYAELQKLSAEAMRFIWQHPTAAAPLKVEVFRARILPESLHNGVSSLDAQEVIKSLTMMPWIIRTGRTQFSSSPTKI